MQDLSPYGGIESREVAFGQQPITHAGALARCQVGPQAPHAKDGARRTSRAGPGSSARFSRKRGSAVAGADAD